ncbi:lysoplasmalogenase family protein [Actinokineospora sp. 24-640]
MPRFAPRHTALAAYGVASVAHLLSLHWGWTAIEWASKPLLALSLLCYVALSPTTARKAYPAAGLVCALAGDVVLQFEGTGAFAAGILCFAAMQVCYQRGFVHIGAVDVLKRNRVIPIAYAAVFLALAGWLVPRVGGVLALLVACYGLLLVATAAIAAGAGKAAGAGGALFLVSDAAIAARAFAGVELPSPWFVMATYACAQLLLVTALVKARHVSPPCVATQDLIVSDLPRP